MADIINLSRVLMIDIETMGLYGDQYAFGYVTSEEGEVVDAGGFHLTKDDALSCLSGTADGIQWVRDNYVVNSESVRVHDLNSLLYEFSRTVKWYTGEGYAIAAECPYPVETSALRRCVDMGYLSFEDSPYPLWDISMIRACLGYDPTESLERNTDLELPAHDPIADCYHSTRLLREALLELNNPI